MRVGDHLKFGCGDVVREIGGRHHARVDRVRSTVYVDVTWLDSRWRSDGLDVDSLELVPASER